MLPAQAQRAPDVSVRDSSGIEVSGVCRRYGRRWALADLSFELPRGQALLVAGRNGSGKTTLLRILATAIRADRGTARVAGFDVHSDRDAVRRQVAMLSHQTYLYEALTAIENLEIAARFLGKAADRPSLLKLLDRFGLGERADDTVSAFSAGMRKRLAFARVILQDGPVVLLDEPYGQLDPPGFRLVDGILASFRKSGVTLVLATHLIERGSALCDRGIVLEEGRLAWSGPAAELPSRGGLAAAGLPEGHS